MSTFQPRIAIAGGGPSGLALALLLSKKGIRSTIYELRSKPTAEEVAKPSGMLDLHQESGLTVIRECGLWEGFRAAIGDCSEATRVMNAAGDILFSEEGQDERRPEIPRHSLARLLQQDLPEESIKWNHKIKSASSTKNNTTGATEITLDLGDNGTATYDFVIGADGAWSKVRQILAPDVKPIYSGVQFVVVTLRHATSNYPHLVELNGPGTIMALGGGRGMLTHRGPQDSIRLYAAVKTDSEDWAAEAGLKNKTAADAKSSLLSDEKLFKNWGPKLRDLLASACEEETKDNPDSKLKVTSLYNLPIGHRWEHQSGLTLIGDAAHLMTPFAGEGVNLALWDSLDLARVLAEAPEAVDAASWQAQVEPRLREFEESMLSRAQEKGEESHQNKLMMFQDDGAEKLAGFFLSMGEHGPEGH